MLRTLYWDVNAALSRAVKHWSSTTLREKLVKIGAKVTRPSKCVTFPLAEVAVPRTLFREILGRIAPLKTRPIETQWSLVVS